MIYTTTGKMEVNCYVDTEFAGLDVYEDRKYSICANSRTEYVITFTDYTLLWV